MLQRQNKNNDLVIQVEGAGISKIEYYTDGLYKYMVDYAPTVYIPSSELQKMNDGQLKCTVYLSTPDNNFDDGTKDMTIDQTFNIWIGSEKAGTNNYYTKDEVDQLIQSVDLSDYYTKDEVDKKITASGTFDGSQYYTKKEVESLIPTDYLTEIPSEYITEDNLKQCLQNNPQSFTSEQKKQMLENLGIFILDSFISENIIENSQYGISYELGITEEDYNRVRECTQLIVNAKGLITVFTERTSISDDYAPQFKALSIANIDSTIKILQYELTAYQKSNNDYYVMYSCYLDNYALKSEIPDTTTLATKSELTTAIGNIDTILDNINGEVV